MLRLSLCFAFLFQVCTFVYAAKPIGKIESVKGEAYIAHLLKKKKVATVGEDVFEKDKIKTGGDGEVVIALSESKLTIGPNAYTKISNDKPGASSTKLSLYGGKVGFKVNKLNAEQSFTVRTPSAVAGVRGTEGEVGYGDGATGVASRKGEDHPSVIYTGTDENAVQGAVQDSREREEQGLPDGGPVEGVTVLNEGTAAVFFADGTSLVIEGAEGLDLDNVISQAQQANAKSNARSTFGNRAAMSAEEWADYLEDLENRIEQIEGPSQNLTLPGPPSGLPSDD